MIKSFADRRTQALYVAGRAKRFPPELAARATRKLEYVDLATSLDDLKVPPGNRLHTLKTDRKGQHAIAINDRWRICFRFMNGDAYDVEVCDHHQPIPEDAPMSIPNTRARTQRPVHPDAMLRDDFLPDYALTVGGVAAALWVSRQSINELLRERRAVSPEMALRLSRLFGNAPEFWLNGQRAVDLWDAAHAIEADMARITPLRVA